MEPKLLLFSSSFFCFLFFLYLFRDQNSVLHRETVGLLKIKIGHSISCTEGMESHIKEKEMNVCHQKLGIDSRNLEKNREAFVIELDRIIVFLELKEEKQL